MVVLTTNNVLCRKALFLSRRRCISAAVRAQTINRTTAPAVYDAVIIGAGHNGLTCAAYLAKKGDRPSLSVIVTETLKSLWFRSESVGVGATSNRWRCVLKMHMRMTVGVCR